MDFHSYREPTSDESLWEHYEAASDILEIGSNEGGPVVPQTAFEYHIRNVAILELELERMIRLSDRRSRLAILFQQTGTMSM